MTEPPREYKLGQTGFESWGNHVSLLDFDGFSKLDLNRELVPVYGHLERRPRVGDTLVGEFQRSHITFRFESVDHMDDPPDMFFAKVRAIDQVMK